MGRRARRGQGSASERADAPRLRRGQTQAVRRPDGGKSLLRQTLERVSVRIPSRRTVVVTMAGQESYLAAEFGHDSPGPHVLQQPEDRGTAAAVLLAAHWIRARDSEARLVVLPSDHFVADDGLFMAHVVEVLNVLEAQPERIILLGAEPTEPETDYAG